LREILQDYYWHFKKLPSSFAIVRPLLAKHDFLYPDAVVTWRILSEKVPDDDNGGRISTIQIDVKGGGVTTSETDVIDLRDPDRTWIYHISDLPVVGNTMEKRAIRNLANGLALAIYRVHAANPSKSVTWVDIDSDWEIGHVVLDDGARDKLGYQVTDKEIVIDVTGTSTVYRYPLSGPKDYNKNL
jgi:hypothetical protein